MYTNGIPCADCARGIIQTGIKEVVVDSSWDEKNAEKWAESAQKSLEMFEECGIKVRYYDGNFMSIVKYKRGKEYNLCDKCMI